jgi:hypothetical protein
LAVIYKVAVFKYLSSTQIRRLFWPHAEHQTAAKRLNQLVQAGYLRRRFIDNRATDEAHNSRLAVFDWPGPCQTKLKQYFIQQRAEDRWQAHAAVMKSHAHDKTVSSGHLRHEIRVSEFFLCLEEAVERDGWKLWWTRTSSPTTKGVSCWVKLDPSDPDSDEVHFSPDSLFALANPQQQFRFGVLEIENRDKKKSKYAYRRRLRGHQAVVEQNIFAGILAEFIAAHQIPLRTDPSQVGIHSLTVGSDEPLRDDLFLACASLSSPDVRFLFASLTDITPATILSPIWLCGDQLFQAFPTQQRLMPGPPLARPALGKRELVAVPRVSLAD